MSARLSKGSSLLVKNFNVSELFFPQRIFRYLERKATCQHYTKKLKKLLWGKCDQWPEIRSVRDLMGRVCNVVLIKCTLDRGKPKKGWNFGREGVGAR
jgi:hypothetical protein